MAPIRLRNCPYRLLSEQQRELTCGMNLAWASGILDRPRRSPFEVALEPEPGRCCVVFRAADSRGQPTRRQGARSARRSPGARQEANSSGNWLMMPSLSMSAMARIWAWTFSYAATLSS